MTEEYKKKLLKYFLGKLEVTKENNVAIFSDVETNATSIIDEIRDAIGGYLDLNIDGAVFCKNGDGSYNGCIVIYGDYYANKKGFMTLFDESLNLLKVFTEYTSGVEFSPFFAVDCDNEGKFFAVENTTQKRLVLLNNLSIKGKSEDYEAKIRTSYFLKGNIANANYIGRHFLVKRNPLKNTFIFATTSNTNEILATQLKVNVGSQNEWIDYVYEGTPPTNLEFIEIYASWDAAEKIKFNLYYLVYNNTLKSNGINYFNNTDENKLQLKEFITPQSNEFATEDKKNLVVNIVRTDIKVVNENNIYIINSGELLNEDTNEAEGKLEANYYVYGRFYRVFDDYGDFTNAIKTAVVPALYLIDNMLVMNYLLLNGNNGNIFPLFKNVVAFIDGKQFDAGIYGKQVINENSRKLIFGIPFFAVGNVYNLYKFSTIYLDAFANKNIGQTYTIFNQNNYNGVAYEDYDLLVPNSAILYNDNDKPIFARNLYNVIINNNITNSTLEVPNNYINDTNVKTQSLIGRSNIELVKNQSNFIKNIYETVYINFINKLVIRNDNNLNNKILNPVGAKRLNEAISYPVDRTDASVDNTIYNKSKLAKYRINYSDNTSLINEIDMNSIEIVGTMGIIDIVVSVPADKSVISIDLISNDEATIYQKITGLTLESEKTYEITQNVEVL